MQFDPIRAAGQRRLEEFLPRAGNDYGATRNHDNGPDRDNVSQLSPWLHAGLVSEREVIAEVLDAHSFDDAEKYIAEVFWRIYFKGYLEHRPSIWPTFCERRDAALADLETSSGRAKAYAEAVEGRTGIAAFNHWARELVETGYLHNHARMWFASIWIFTLKIDWTLGADFFLRHLMDGDAASNTLSWRWVGGLHTAGKTYLARADNIRRYTEHHPEGPLEADRLSDKAEVLTEGKEHVRQPLDLPDAPDDAAFEQPYALLLHDEGASHAMLDLPHPPTMVIGAARPDARSPLSVGERAREFALGSVRCGVADAGKDFGCPTLEWQDEGALYASLEDAGIARVVTPFIPTGWTRDALWPELAPLAGRGAVIQLLPELDRLTFPHARAGFFRVKKEIPRILSANGLAAG